MTNTPSRVEILSGKEDHFTVHVPGATALVEVVVSDPETKKFLIKNRGKSVEGVVLGSNNVISVNPDAPVTPIPEAPPPKDMGDHWSK